MKGKTKRIFFIIWIALMIVGNISIPIFWDFLEITSWIEAVACHVVYGLCITIPVMFIFAFFES